MPKPAQLASNPFSLPTRKLAATSTQPQRPRMSYRFSHQNLLHLLTQRPGNHHDRHTSRACVK